VRRQFNLAFFDRLIVDEDYTVRGELAPPFDVILGDELRRRAAVAKADAETLAAVEEALRQRPVHAEPENEQRPPAALVGADSPTTPSEVVGWSQINMVDFRVLSRNPAARVEALRRALADSRGPRPAPAGGTRPPLSLEGSRGGR
jgi:hypothetical protein